MPVSIEDVYCNAARHGDWLLFKLFVFVDVRL